MMKNYTKQKYCIQSFRLFDYRKNVDTGSKLFPPSGIFHCKSPFIFEGVLGGVRQNDNIRTEMEKDLSGQYQPVFYYLSARKNRKTSLCP
ncbi:hypothetical protein CEXT_205521 [Caerostris extrusa]|uniref:Uncharacterized protein n=1 Tax=Caerostris extrusa TaxID=172846 RepID=A0AAV4QQ25_CAEEX|nr:hypothetical protein CEXT_205521 [Caerostris extrusa]